MLRKLLLKLFYNPKKEAAKHKKYILGLLETTLKINGISYKEVKAIYAISVSNYHQTLFERAKREIINGSYIIPYDDPPHMTWNGDHLHLSIAFLDEDVYVYAIVVPYEFTQLPKSLWLHKLQNPSQEYLDRLARVKIY